MRFFLIKNGPIVVGKNVYGGDDKSADVLAAKDAGSFVAVEVDQITFEGTSLPLPKDQTDWQTAKGQGTANALSYLGKKMGLE